LRPRGSQRRLSGGSDRSGQPAQASEVVAVKQILRPAQNDTWVELSSWTKWRICFYWVTIYPDNPDVLSKMP